MNSVLLSFGFSMLLRIISLVAMSVSWIWLWMNIISRWVVRRRLNVLTMLTNWASGNPFNWKFSCWESSLCLAVCVSGMQKGLRTNREIATMGNIILFKKPYLIDSNKDIRINNNWNTSSICTHNSCWRRCFHCQLRCD